MQLTVDSLASCSMLPFQAVSDKLTPLGCCKQASWQAASGGASGAPRFQPSPRRPRCRTCCGTSSGRSACPQPSPAGSPRRTWVWHTTLAPAPTPTRGASSAACPSAPRLLPWLQGRCPAQLPALQLHECFMVILDRPVDMRLTWLWCGQAVTARLDLQQPQGCGHAVVPFRAGAQIRVLGAAHAPAPDVRPGHLLAAARGELFQ